MIQFKEERVRILLSNKGTRVLECYKLMKPCSIKVLATLGPTSMKYEVISSMVEAGVAGFRINMSHGSPSVWDEMLKLILEAEEQHGVYPAIIFDLEGPRIRIAQSPATHVEPGQKIKICDNEQDECLKLTHKGVIKHLEPGDIILVDDGKTVLRILEKHDESVTALVVGGYSLEPGKGIAVRGKHIPLEPLTEKDLQCLDYLRGKPVSHIMLSYVADGDHVKLLRHELEKRGLDHVDIMAKIETPRGVQNIDEISKEADAIVIARGDLGMHYPLEEIPLVSSKIAEAAVKNYKPLIVATEILTSMIERPIPTRAEIVDIYKAVELGADGLLLTGETAIGRFPVKAVEWALRVASLASSKIKSPRPEARGVAYRLALALVETAEDIDAPIIAYTMKGRLPKRIASFKPTIKVYAGTRDPLIYRKLMVLRSIFPIHVEATDYQEGLERTSSTVLERLGRDSTFVEASWSRENRVFQIKVRNIHY